MERSDAVQAKRYQKEFPGFELNIVIPEGFDDISWANNRCPSFINKDLDLILWVDYENEEDREYPELPRFSLDEVYGGQFPILSDYKALMMSDDIDQVLKTIDEFKAKRKGLEDKAEEICAAIYKHAQLAVIHEIDYDAGVYESGHIIRDKVANPIVRLLKNTEWPVISTAFAKLHDEESVKWKVVLAEDVLDISAEDIAESIIEVVKPVLEAVDAKNLEGMKTVLSEELCKYLQFEVRQCEPGPELK